MPSYPLSQFTDLEEMMCKVKTEREEKLSRKKSWLGQEAGVSLQA